MKKYKYNINNLDCANCARKLEESLNQNSKLQNVIVNFNTSKISYEAKEEITLEELNKIVKEIETSCYITETEKAHTKKEYHICLLLISLFIALIAITLKLPTIIKEILIIISYVLLLYKPFLNALKMIIKNKTINENALIVISCIGAYFLKETLEGIMVVSLYILGKILEEKAVNNTRKEVKNILDIKQDYANKKENNKLKKINVEEIKINDILIIKKGEKIPTDGIIIKGQTKLDLQILTGETELVEVKVNNTVLSGSINVESIIEIKVTNTYNNSTVAQILNLVEEATDKKATIETTVSKLSKIYTPTILILSILVFIFLPIITKITYTQSLYRALTFLVISCPCAIAISVPLSYFTGIGVSSKNGILIKGSNYLDNLSYLNKIVFDKTGTLTTGTFSVTKLEITDKNYTKDEIIEIITKGESLSNHPIAKSILKLTNKEIINNDIKNYKEISGKGISFNLNEDKIEIGNKKICNCENIADIHLKINNKHIASIEIDDGIKENAKEQISKLKKLGLKTYMFTGDKKEVAEEISKRLEIDETKYEMLPNDKYKEYESLCDSQEIVAFVGDGINDAPVLKRSDIGISMGNIGSSSAIEASDIVIMNDDLSKIPLAINISKYTNHIIKQNLIFAISVKASILILSILGIATMWFAVFADTGVTLIAILNTLRIMQKYK